MILPSGVDDPARCSGGNRYDREVCEGLRTDGWVVHEHPVAGRWPTTDVAALAGLRAALERVPRDGLVLVDGLVGSTADEVMVTAARCRRIVVLVHLPFGLAGGAPAVPDADRRERQVLTSATGVVATSRWTRRFLLDRYGLRESAVHVAVPGASPAAVATGTPMGGALLCVAAVCPHKGQDVLLDAVGRLGDRAWHLRLVGSLSRDAGFVAELRGRAERLDAAGRVDLAGPRSGAALEAAYRAADVVVVPSRVETFGMVVSEALARGLPVVASDVGGLPEALGHAAADQLPGLLVAPDDPVALAAALRAWLDDDRLRCSLRAAALARRPLVRDWSDTTADIARVLEAVAA